MEQNLIFFAFVLATVTLFYRARAESIAVRRGMEEERLQCGGGTVRASWFEPNLNPPGRNEDKEQKQKETKTKEPTELFHL